jgi:hypothetical protein
MASDRVLNGGVAEQQTAREVANKIWAEFHCQTGSNCTQPKGTFGDVVNRELEDAGKSNPSENAFQLAADLDVEASRRQQEIRKTMGNAAGSNSADFMFWGRIHRIMDKRTDQLEKPDNFVLPPCDCR